MKIGVEYVLIEDEGQSPFVKHMIKKQYGQESLKKKQYSQITTAERNKTNSPVPGGGVSSHITDINETYFF